MVGKWSFITVWLLIMLIVFGYTIGTRTEQGLLGAAFGLLVFISIYTAFFGIAFLWAHWQPSIPSCKKQKCKRFKDYDSARPSDDGYLYSCSCGDQYLYVKSQSGGVKYMELLPDNTTRPYMKRSRLGRWKVDDVDLNANI